MTTSSINQCLICHCDKVNSLTGDFNYGSRLSSISNSLSSTSEQLHVIFILRRVLEVPSDKLAIYLKNHGNPENWIWLCSRCSLMVDQAKTTYQMLLYAKKKFFKTREVIINTVKRSGGNSQQGCNTESRLSHSQVTEEIRRFSKNRVYGPFKDPFIIGDARAQDLISNLATTADNNRNNGEDLAQFKNEPSDHDPSFFPGEDDSYGCGNDSEGDGGLQLDTYPPDVRNDSLLPVFHQAANNAPVPSKIGSGTHKEIGRASTEIFRTTTKFGKGKTHFKNRGIRFQCLKCPRNFAQKRNLQFHLYLVHGEKNLRTYYCKFCPKRTIYRQILKMHLNKEHQVFPTHQLIEFMPTHRLQQQQQQSEETYSGPENNSPEQCVTAYRPFNCPRCPLFFQSINELKSHAEMVHSKAPVYCCHICGMSSKYGNFLSRHFRRRHNNIDFDQIPNDIGANLSKIEKAPSAGEGNELEHGIIRKPPKRKKIPMKRRKLSLLAATAIAPEGKSEAIKREKKKFDETKKQFQCSQCPLRYVEFSALKKHVSIKHGEHDKFCCYVCGMTTPYRHVLNRHLFEVHDLTEDGTSMEKGEVGGEPTNPLVREEDSVDPLEVL